MMRPIFLAIILVVALQASALEGSSFGPPADEITAVQIKTLPESFGVIQAGEKLKLYNAKGQLICDLPISKCSCRTK